MKTLLFLVIAILLNHLVSTYTNDMAIITASGLFFGLCAIELGKKKAWNPALQK